MSLDRAKWGITDWECKSQNKDFILETDRMNSEQALCKVCGCRITILTHQDFKPLCDDLNEAKQSQRGDSERLKGNLGFLDQIKDMGTCEYCYETRIRYDKSREVIEEIMQWANRNFNKFEKEWMVEVEVQTKHLESLKFWLKKWADALRRMRNQVDLVNIEFIARILWLRPWIANAYIWQLENTLYNGQSLETTEKALERAWQKAKNG